ncbi:hypothetical protein HZ326_6142 [Fusarium oxysporum f. sp. albedinis]|nr:hypothetical protein HZ326_6142 [Fusarium oxysporum f. sp. albedinis]
MVSSNSRLTPSGLPFAWLDGQRFDLTLVAPCHSEHSLSNQNSEPSPISAKFFASDPQLDIDQSFSDGTPKRSTRASAQPESVFVSALIFSSNGSLELEVCSSEPVSNVFLPLLVPEVATAKPGTSSLTKLCLTGIFVAANGWIWSPPEPDQLKIRTCPSL